MASAAYLRYLKHLMATKIMYYQLSNYVFDLLRDPQIDGKVDEINKEKPQAAATA